MASRFTEGDAHKVGRDIRTLEMMSREASKEFDAYATALKNNDTAAITKLEKSLLDKVEKVATEKKTLTDLDRKGILETAKTALTDKASSKDLYNQLTDTQHEKVRTDTQHRWYNTIHN